MADAFIIDAVRTPRGKRKGSLSFTHPIDLAATPIKEIVDRNDLDPDQIDDLIYGCVTQRGEQDNVIGREAVLAAGLPEEVPGCTVNRFCGSGLTASNMAAHAVMAGQADLIIGGGIEHMTRCEMNIDFNSNMANSKLPERYPHLYNQGQSAEMIVEKYGFTRDQLDEFAVRSQQLAALAWEQGKFSNSIVPVEAKTQDGKTFLFEKDEHLRPGTTKAALAALKTVFKENGTIHAGNSSGIVDGAACVLFASERKIKEVGLKPRARVVATVEIGDDPIFMLLGPIKAIPKVCEKAGLRIQDIDLFEINEAFAPVPLSVIKELEVDPKKINVNGGAIALGHPLGATGAMLLGTVLDELERTKKRYGLVTLCIGLGMAVATIIERV
ncbi:MAG: acetyl-CoA C-acyltransferase [Deltaproteobacteria bacterium]|nr:acetyl-CoA C-acyltransferase [Deltaproteobacteria bacterium]